MQRDATPICTREFLCPSYVAKQTSRNRGQGQSSAGTVMLTGQRQVHRPPPSIAADNWCTDRLFAGCALHGRATSTIATANRCRSSPGGRVTPSKPRHVAPCGRQSKRLPAGAMRSSYHCLLCDAALQAVSLRANPRGRIRNGGFVVQSCACGGEVGWCPGAHDRRRVACHDIATAALACRGTPDAEVHQVTGLLRRD